MRKKFEHYFFTSFNSCCIKCGLNIDFLETKPYCKKSDYGWKKWLKNANNIPYVKRLRRLCPEEYVGLMTGTSLLRSVAKI